MWTIKIIIITANFILAPLSLVCNFLSANDFQLENRTFHSASKRWSKKKEALAKPRWINNEPWTFALRLLLIVGLQAGRKNEKLTGTRFDFNFGFPKLCLPMGLSTYTFPVFQNPIVECVNKERVNRFHRFQSLTFSLLFRFLLQTCSSRLCYEYRLAVEPSRV